MSRILYTVNVLCPAGDKLQAKSILTDFFKTVPLSMVLGLYVLFWIFWWAPFLTIGRFRSLGRLNEAERERYFSWWEQHRFYWLREIFYSLKTIALLAMLGRAWGPTS